MTLLVREARFLSFRSLSSKRNNLWKTANNVFLLNRNKIFPFSLESINIYDVNMMLSGNVWREDSYVLSLMGPLSVFKQNSTLLPGTEVIVWGRLGSPLVNTLFRTKLLSLVPLSWDRDCLLTFWLTLPLVPLVTVAVRLVFWSLSFPKEVSCTTAYIYS